MGLKSLYSLHKTFVLTFAPCMGLKSYFPLRSFDQKVFAPCMGLKSSLFNRVS